jgi:hypothetical protein
MPTYRVVGTLNHDNVTYLDGESITLSAGPVCDSLLTAGAIYRPDLGPRRPRYWNGGVLLPCRYVDSPNPVARHWFYSVNGKVQASSEMVAAALADSTKPSRRFEPVDEWSIAENVWPLTKHESELDGVLGNPSPFAWPSAGTLSWQVFPVSWAPKNGFRLIR